jgi:hypothetical protein
VDRRQHEALAQTVVRDANVVAAVALRDGQQDRGAGRQDPRT